MSISTKERHKKLLSMRDEDIDYSDIPPTADDFWDKAELVMPAPKKAISLRVDEEVLEFFKKDGPGYQTRMLAVLKAYMDAKLGKQQMAK